RHGWSGRRTRYRLAGFSRPRGGARRAVADMDAAGERHPGAGAAAVRIAIAEDNVLLREGLSQLLVDAGFDVLARCGDADELRAAVSSELPDVVIVDIRLPPTHRRRDAGGSGYPAGTSRGRGAGPFAIRRGR